MPNNKRSKQRTASGTPHVAANVNVPIICDNKQDIGGHSKGVVSAEVMRVYQPSSAVSTMRVDIEETFSLHMLIKLVSFVEGSGEDGTARDQGSDTRDSDDNNGNNNDGEENNGGAKNNEGENDKGGEENNESEKKNDDTDDDADDECPENYVLQETRWYRPGRHFEVFAPQDQEIHRKRFILLDSKNEGGTGVRVDVLENVVDLDRLNRESFPHLENMVLTCCDSSHGNNTTKHEKQRKQEIKTVTQEQLLEQLKDKIDPVRMLEHGRVETFVKPGSFIRLGHTYNIPFHYRCEDLGFIDGRSLKELRFRYLKWAAWSWDIEERCAEHWASKRP